MHEKLKQLRKKAKLTQSQVSLLMGVSVSRIRQIEQGKSVLKLNTIQRYCKAIGVSVGVRFE
jgi:transcriptional regulator with XRE-family HTH domain